MPALARKAALSVLATASCVILVSPPAQAAAPPPSGPSAPPGQPAAQGGGYTTDASYCLPDEDGNPPESDPYDDVSSVDEFGSDNKYLYCGDPSKGVLHIDEDHPIDRGSDDDEYLRTCVQNFGSYGNELPPGEDPNNYVMDMPLDKNEDGRADDSARLAYSKEKNDDGIYPVVSVATKQTENYPQGNDWYGCAEYPFSTSGAHQHVERQ